MDLKTFLKERMEEKGFTRNALHLETITIFGLNGAISSTRLADILNKGDIPGPEILRKLARVLCVSYYTLMKLACYITDEDVAEVKSSLKEAMQDNLSSSSLEVLLEEDMIKILVKLSKLNTESRKEALRGLKTYLRGFI